MTTGATRRGGNLRALTEAPTIRAEPSLPIEPGLDDGTRASDPDARTRRPGALHSSGRLDLVVAAWSGLVSLLLTIPALRLWRADISVPFAYSGDANSHGMLMKAVLDHGWYEENPSLGAPAGQHFHDFPMPDNLHLFAAKLLGLFSPSYGAVLNLYYLAGFGLAGFFATYVLTKLGASRAVALVLGILYAFAPYHFIRGEAQLFLASYYAVPLGVLLSLGALGHVELFPVRPGAQGRTARVSWGSAATIGMCLLVGSSSAYYGAFAAILVGVVVLTQGILNRDRRALLVGLAVAAAISLTVLVNVLPDLLWSRAHGANDEAVFRAPGDTETYSLKLTQLLLPSPHHRIEALGDMGERYLRDFPLPSEPHPLGAAAALGVVYVVGLAGATLLRGGRERPSDRLPVHLGLLTIAALLAAMTGGLASLFELVFIPILRGWNRIAIFIAFLGLAAVGVLLDRLRTRWFSKRSVAFAAILLAVLVVGLLDQTSPDFLPDYEGNRAAFHSDADFVDRIETALAPKSMVFQLPFVEFPEAGPVNGMTDYDHFRGYLHSRSLRWSYGGIKGRPEADWAEGVAEQQPVDALPKLAAVGFDGIYIDRAGYVDLGASVELALSSMLDQQPMVSRNGRLSFFDLSEFRRSFIATHDAEEVATLRRDALHPVGADWTRGFYEVERQGQTSWRWATADSTLELDNSDSATRSMEISFAAETGSTATSALSVSVPGRPTEAFAVTNVPTPVTLKVDLAPGVTALKFHVDAPAVVSPTDPRDLRLKVLNFRVSTANAASG